MGKPTVPYARNIIRRTLFEIIDPSPAKREIDEVWIHFESACAYCATPLVRGTKQAHLDHLVPTSAGGRNHVANRVLSCATCNEHEKREMPWEDFLAQKTRSTDEFSMRRQKVLDWTTRFSENEVQLRPEVLALLNDAVDEATSAFTRQVERIRASKLDFKTLE
jgi:CRISPR/Cas system Type II protein with McrA/HNH and RuvC-like nuclease domain